MYRENVLKSMFSLKPQDFLILSSSTTQLLLVKAIEMRKPMRRKLRRTPLLSVPREQSRQKNSQHVPQFEKLNDNFLPLYSRSTSFLKLPSDEH
jgi:hypothetical protein